MLPKGRILQSHVFPQFSITHGPPGENNRLYFPDLNLVKSGDVNYINERRNEVENLRNQEWGNEAEGLLLVESSPDVLQYQSPLHLQHFLCSSLICLPRPYCSITQYTFYILSFLLPCLSPTIRYSPQERVWGCFVYCCVPSSG